MARPSLNECRGTTAVNWLILPVDLRPCPKVKELASIIRASCLLTSFSISLMNRMGLDTKQFGDADQPLADL